MYSLVKIFNINILLFNGFNVFKIILPNNNCSEYGLLLEGLGKVRTVNRNSTNTNGINTK